MIVSSVFPVAAVYGRPRPGVQYIVPCAVGLPRYESSGRASWPSRASESQHLGEVARVEARLGVFVDARHRRFEPPDGVAGALGMGVVGGEEQQLNTDLLDDPADELGREWRELHLTADVVRRAQRE